MSTKEKVVVPLVAVSPYQNVLGELIGAIVGVGGDLGVSYCVQWGEDFSKNNLPYGIQQTDQSEIQLGVLQRAHQGIHTLPNSPVPLLVLAKGGGEGEGLMVLSNFARDAWLYHETLRPDVAVDALDLQAWGPLRIPTLDRGLFNLYVTFEHLWGGCTKATLAAKIFNHRDYAHDRLDYQMRGRMVNMRDEAVKGKRSKSKPQCTEACRHYRPLNFGEGICDSYGHQRVRGLGPLNQHCFEPSAVAGVIPDV